MTTERISIETPDGKTLSGALELPSGLIRGAALFSHCFTCTKGSKAAVEVTRALAREGIATLRFDFTGLGGSDGDFGRAGFSTDVEDLVSTARYLIDRFGDRILLVGHSLGGAAVLAAADDIGTDNIAAIATIAAPADVDHSLQRIKGDLEKVKEDGSGEVEIGGRPFEISKTFLEKAENANLREEVKRLHVPLMIMHSPTDSIVSIDNAHAIFHIANHPKSFVSILGADHLLLDERDARFAAGLIANWASRYMPDEPDWPEPEDGVIVRTGTGKFGTEIHTASHHFVADEPLSYGGTDTGPTPYDLLMAGLGTCTTMTMKLYADRKKWPMDRAIVHVTHERNHGSLLAHGEAMASGAQIQALNREITIEGDALTDEQRERLMEIADKCPVHKTLEGRLHIHTKQAGE